MEKIKQMARDFAAFALKAFASGGQYERREGMPEMKQIADMLTKLGTAFDEFKTTNNERLAQIEKRGAADPLIDAKLANIDKHIAELGEAKAAIEAIQRKLARPGALIEGAKQYSPEAIDYKQAFINYVRTPNDPQVVSNLHAKSKALQAALRRDYELRYGSNDGWEQRAANVTTATGSAGGFALPEEIAAEIARLSVDISPIRQIATVRPVGTSDYKELFDINGAAFEWVGEGGTRSQTNTPDLAEVAPTFGTASARPRATEESLDDLFFDVEAWLISSVAEAMAQGEGTAFVSGNGTNRPTGFLTGTPVATADASRAFGVLQYTPSGQAAAMPTSADVFYDIVYALRARYRANATWVTSKLVLAAMRKYKATDNNYLWQPSLVLGQPDTFMGYRVVEAEDMQAVAANNFPVAFGDFREGYLIADRVGMRITRDEITVPGFVQFYCRKRVGGRIRNSQAIKLLKIATT